MTDDSATTAEIQEMDQKQFRKEFPSGWMTLTRYETVVLILDALLESPAERPLTIEELANKSGATRRSINDRIGNLVDLGIVNRRETASDENAYSINNDSPITKRLYDLNITVQQVQEGSIDATVVENTPVQEVTQEKAVESKSQHWEATNSGHLINDQQNAGSGSSGFRILGEPAE